MMMKLHDQVKWKRFNLWVGCQIAHPHAHINVLLIVL